MRYLKEIAKAIRDRKSLPDAFKLLNQYKRWTKHLTDRDVYKNSIPWITFQAIDFLEKNLTKEMHVFEYGGGGSTLFFASKVKELVTVEHNKEWFEGLRNKMNENTAIKWTGYFIEAESTPSTKGLAISNPEHYYSEDVSFRDKIFKKYASVIDQYPDQHFDVILIDGRVRPSCLQHSLSKVKINGLLILDNSDRTYYLENFKGKLNNYKLLSENYGPTPYVSWFTQTNIWRRIK